MNVQDLLHIADAYKEAEGVADSTVSHRVFGDTKKLAALRSGSDITVGRFNAALAWFAANWPIAAELPDVLKPFAIVTPTTNEDAA